MRRYSPQMAERATVVVEFPTWKAVGAELANWPARRWAVAVAAAGAVALAMGIPTGVVPSSLYHRMTPTTWWDYPIWGASAVLLGLVVASYVRVGDASPAGNGTGRTLGGGLVSTLAIGCPICNKIVVALVGVSGALDYWAPLQPFLGLLGVGLLALTLVLRLRGAAACSARPA